MADRKRFGMRNVMVCVTQQRTCDRLIKFGHEMLTDQGGELHIVHVTGIQDDTYEDDNKTALAYLYTRAAAYGAQLTIEQSDDVVETLVELVRKHKITHIVMGESREATGRNRVIENMRGKTIGVADVIVLPA